MRAFLAGLTAVLALIVPVMALATGADPSLVKPDPDVLIGRLSNGLRYAIKQQPSHQKEVIDFYVEAGSLDETGVERGTAHYLEHMAFNGSRHFPPGDLSKTFEQAGIASGRDQNAATTYFATSYILDIPNETADKLDLGFRWLRDVADGLAITPAETDRERGVVLSEYRLGLGVGRTLGQAQLHFFLPGLRLADRLPIGEAATIQQLDSDAIRAFYQRWYRPDRVILVAVGDEPVTTIKARIEASFSSWTTATPAPPHPDIGRVDFRRTTEAKTLTDSHLPSTLTVCRYSPKPAHRPEDVDVTRDRLADTIWSYVFSRRMNRLVQKDNPPFLSATGGYSIRSRTVGQTCFVAVGRLDDWKVALDRLSQEIRRLEQYGVTQKELDDAKARIVANLDAGVLSAATVAPEAVATSILNNLIEDDTFDNREEQRRVYTLALNNLGKSEVATAFHRHWTEAAPPLILLSGPSAASSAEILSDWTRLQSEPAPAPPDDVDTAAWAYGDTGATGAVIAREAFKDPDFVRITFANGVILNFKQTDFSKNLVNINVAFGAGQREFPSDRFIDAGLGANALYSGALKRNDLDDLSQHCQGHVCNAALQLGRTSFDLRGATRPADLTLELQILGAFLTEPGFRPNMATSMPTVASLFYRQIKSIPILVVSRTLNNALPPPHIDDTESQAHLAGLTSADFAALLKTPLTTDPLEVTIVGDIDEADAVKAMITTLAALPPRKAGDRTRADAISLRYADTPPPPITAYHEGSKDQAVVQLTWPLYAWAPDRAHETRAISLLARVMQDALTDTVRQKLAKSYSPKVGVNFPRGGDQAALTIQIQTAPDAVEIVQAEALKIVKDFASGGVSAEALTRARTPWLEAIAKERTYNSWWISALDGSARFPDKLIAARVGADDLKTMTPAEVGAEARLWLSKTPYIIIAVPAHR